MKHSIYDGAKYLIKDKKTGKEAVLTIHTEDNPENPREWDLNICHIVSNKGNWNISDKGYAMSLQEFCEHIISIAGIKEIDLQDPEDIDEIIEKVKDKIYIRFIYMYDHSGQTIRLTPFGDPWDSGICGIIYVTRDEIAKNVFAVDNVSDEVWEATAKEEVEKEIKIYDEYITGDVYWYKIEEKHRIKHIRMDTWDTWETEEPETVESCGGFYGSDNDDLFQNVIDNGWEIIKEIN